ncbi:hypothetical protein FRB93_008736 [Tulasnella sp. JGI-2019a]|nr:hypothetical protein FRB93_008736 [Tulasnella sp. JGI-2019a]
MVELWYWIDGISSTPELHEYDGNGTRVAHFQAFIESRLLAMQHPVPHSLGIWKLKSPLRLDAADIVEQLQVVFRDPETRMKMRSNHKLSDLFSNVQVDQLDIVVERPDTVSADSSVAIDVGATLVQRWLTRHEGLPHLCDLRTALDRPLPDDEKISLSSSDMEALMTDSSKLGDRVTRGDMEHLFIVSKHQVARRPLETFRRLIFQDAPLVDNTESSFIGFWDDNISNLMRLVFNHGRVIRNSNQETSKHLSRPDFGFLLREVCVFRGKETQPGYAGKHPRVELIQKMAWTYDPAPYVLGCWAIGMEVTLCAIHPAAPEPIAITLGVFDLSLKINRIMHAIRMINICSFLQPLRDLIGDHATESLPIQRETKIITPSDKSIKKQYVGPNRQSSVQYLHKMYQILEVKRAPNVDKILAFYFDDPTHGSVLYLAPRGDNRFPTTIIEVVQAVISVLEVLQVIHQPPVLLHRDIRWPNIVKSLADSSKWILIDWEDASEAPTFAHSDLEPNSHAPSVMQDNHGPEVDIWSVGYLLHKTHNMPGISQELKEISRRMMRNPESWAAKSSFTAIKLEACFMCLILG